MNPSPMTRFRDPPERDTRRISIRLALYTALVLLCALPPASGKRAAPAPVPAVTIASVEYAAPPSAMGFVVATDKKTGRELWRQRIYKILRDPGLESEVQDVFINGLELVNGRLLIRNERGKVFLLDPVTRSVIERP